MKPITRNSFYLILLIIAVSSFSCSVNFEKRRYRPGYHIEVQYRYPRQQSKIKTFDTQRPVSKETVVVDSAQLQSSSIEYLPEKVKEEEKPEKNKTFKDHPRDRRQFDHIPLLKKQQGGVIDRVSERSITYQDLPAIKHSSETHESKHWALGFAILASVAGIFSLLFYFIPFTTAGIFAIVLSIIGIIESIISIIFGFISVKQGEKRRGMAALIIAFAAMILCAIILTLKLIILL